MGGGGGWHLFTGVYLGGRNERERLCFGTFMGWLAVLVSGSFGSFGKKKIDLMVDRHASRIHV